MTTKPDHLAQIERVQKMLAGAAPLDKLEDGRRGLKSVVESIEAERAEIEARRETEMTAATPIVELNSKLDSLERRERELARIAEIGLTILGEIDARIVEAREAESAAKRQAVYDAALDLHNATLIRVREFLDRAGRESLEVMRAYAASEAATAATNCDLPEGSSPIPTIESERLGASKSRRTIKRQFGVFYCGDQPIAEVGRCHATANSDGTFTVLIWNRTVGNCRIRDFVNVRCETMKPRAENLGTSLKIPAFLADYVSDRYVDQPMTLQEWDRLNGVEASPSIAAE
jgi:hypothetical protein